MRETLSHTKLLRLFYKSTPHKSTKHLGLWSECHTSAKQARSMLQNCSLRASPKYIKTRLMWGVHSNNYTRAASMKVSFNLPFYFSEHGITFIPFHMLLDQRVLIVTWQICFNPVANKLVVLPWVRLEQ